MNMLNGKKFVWHLPQILDSEVVLNIAQQYNLSFPVAHTLVNRGYIEKKAIEAFIFSAIEKDVGRPEELKDAQKAVFRILEAIEKKQKILVFGDYDVDGITSSALMMLCLKPLGAQINFFLPHRSRDGYGLSVDVVRRAAKNNYALIITVDNGITAFDPADEARKEQIDLIITDHHRPHDILPKAYAIVNPQQFDCQYPFKHFAGVGVTFKILSLLYEQKNIKLPQKAMELMVLGTIADVVPLKGENRYWVKQGLHIINKQKSFAVQVLEKNSGLNKEIISSTDIGFSMTPQINALGRLEDPRQAVKFLIGSDKQEIEHVGLTLAALNQARKDIERSILEQICQQIQSKKIDLSTERIIVAAHNQWPPGVIGLVASRLVSMYHRPTILFHITKDGIAKGSCRSIPEFNMFDALHSCRDMLSTFGGHSLAAGLSLPLKHVAQLKQHLEDQIGATLNEYDLQPKLHLDAPLSLPEINVKIMKDLLYLEPFGHENEAPLFYIANVALLNKPMLLKNAHVKCSVFSEGIIKPIIFFNRPDIYVWLKEHQEELFDVAAYISENHWQGKRSIELRGIDIALTQSK